MSTRQQISADDRAMVDPDADSIRRLLAPGIKLILIKGAPGTGKTSLAIRLLEYVESGAYISTRVGFEKLSKQNPRLIRLESKGQLQEVSFDAGKVKYDDLRLGTPSFAMEQIVNASTLGKELIILDSWDTMAKEMERTERLKTEKTIAAIIDASKARAVFISEEPELTSTDYLVDAILTLGYLDLDGRRVREMVWEKLRGQGILDQKSIYTLKDGRFTLVPKPGFELTLPKKFTPMPHSETHFSTGSKDFDDFLGGGFKRGTFVLLEFGGTVTNERVSPIINLIRSNFMLNGGNCVVVPELEVTPKMVLDAITPYVGGEGMRQRFKVFTYLPAHDHTSIVDVRGKSMEESMKMQLDILRQFSMDLNGQRQPTLWSLSLDAYETFVFKNLNTIGNHIAQTAAMLRQAGDVVLVTAKHSTSNLRLLSDSSDIHLKLEEVDGVVLLYAKRPPSSAFGLFYASSLGYPEVRLARIM